MSEPIKVGDLVVVVHWPHEHCNQLGKIWLVESFSDACHCKFCNKLFEGRIAWTPTICACPVSWLHRIPPLGELDETEHKEELPA